MTTHIQIKSSLVNKTLRLGSHKTKKAAVIAALEEYVRRHSQLEILKFFGKVGYDPTYDYKVQRNRQ